MILEESIPAALEGERVDRVVAMLTGCTRAASAFAIGAGWVHLDGETAEKPSIRVAVGQRLQVSELPVPKDAKVEPDASVEIEVLHADDDVIVIKKQAGQVVHPGAGTVGPTLVSGLLAVFPELATVGEPHRPGIVHRLDKGTSGLMVVARTNDAYEDLVAQLSIHAVERRYQALVWGTVTTPSGTIDAPIGRSRRNPMNMSVQADGKAARTHYRLIRHFAAAGISHLELALETGRTHQIRVHCATIGHPIVDDDAYGPRRPRETFGVRPLLQAVHLGFDHPRTGEPLTFDIPLDAEFGAVMDELAHRDEELNQALDGFS